MQKDNAELRTFIDYGFSGFPEILPLRTGKKVPPTEILLPRSEVVSRSYLLSQIAELARNKSLSGKGDLGFVVALAYFLDGHVECCEHAYNGMQFLPRMQSYAPDFYKSAKSPRGCNNNIDAISRIYVPQNPEAIMILQEVEGDERNYRFRFIHTAMAKPSNGKLASKLRLIDAGLNYVRALRENDTLTAQELEELRAIFTMFSVLDPQGRYVTPDSLPTKPRDTKILQFEDKKK